MGARPPYARLRGVGHDARPRHVAAPGVWRGHARLLGGGLALEAGHGLAGAAGLGGGQLGARSLPGLGHPLEIINVRLGLHSAAVVVAVVAVAGVGGRSLDSQLLVSSGWWRG